jgi:uncharacterized protein YecE (DUF72 family)
LEAAPYFLSEDCILVDVSLSAAEHKEPAIFVGSAGWSLSSAVKENFPAEGSHLERYASVFSAVEINTSFYRPHRSATYARWRDSVPAPFRFSAKVPKVITHELRLQHIDEPLQRFLGEVGHLQEKLGCLLVQLPPSLQYDAAVAGRFFEKLRALTKVDVVCEPRHPTWFGAAAADMLEQAGVAHVIADPPAVELPVPAVSARTVYIRLHGSPDMYYSAYTEEYLARISKDIEERLGAGKRVWCIFDNTANGAAVPNALSLLSRLRPDQAAANCR